MHIQTERIKVCVAFSFDFDNIFERLKFRSVCSFVSLLFFSLEQTVYPKVSYVADFLNCFLYIFGRCYATGILCQRTVKPRHFLNN